MQAGTSPVTGYFRRGINQIKQLAPCIYPTPAKWLFILQWSSWCESLLGGEKKKGDGPQSTRHNKRSGERRPGRRSEEICFAGMPGGLRASQLSKTVICASLSICAPAFCLLKISTFVFFRAASFGFARGQTDLKALNWSRWPCFGHVLSKRPAPTHRDNPLRHHSAFWVSQTGLTTAALKQQQGDKNPQHSPSSHIHTHIVIWFPTSPSAPPCTCTWWLYLLCSSLRRLPLY